METLILDPSNNSCIDNLETNYPNIDIFYLKPGIYTLTKPLDINKEGVRIIGYSGSAKDVHIKQTSNDKNAFCIYANNVTIKYISIHIPYDSKGICLTQTNSSWGDIEDCTFYGGDNYCVYIFNNIKSDGKTKINYSVSNLFNNNIIYAKNSGKAISFGCQECSSIKNNIIRGGLVMLHLLNKCLISNNIITDSSDSGISLFLPTYNTHIVGNNIKNSKKTGLSMKMIQDYIDWDIQKDHNVIIEKNTICDSVYHGLEINDGAKLVIQKNCINKSGETSIYLLKTINSNINANTLSIYKKGIMIDLNCNGNEITNNSLYAVYPEESEFGIGTHIESQNNNIENNLISGSYISNQFVKKQNETNKFDNNDLHQYISYIDEMKLAKL